MPTDLVDEASFCWFSHVDTYAEQNHTHTRTLSVCQFVIRDITALHFGPIDGTRKHWCWCSSIHLYDDWTEGRCNHISFNTGQQCLWCFCVVLCVTKSVWVADDIMFVSVSVLDGDLTVIMLYQRCSIHLTGKYWCSVPVAHWTNSSSLLWSTTAGQFTAGQGVSCILWLLSLHHHHDHHHHQDHN